MPVKEMFEKLGYTQKIYDKESNPLNNGIQYTYQSPKSEMERVGMIKTKVIEIYLESKEILMFETTKHRDGNVTKSDVVILNSDVFNALQTQIKELKWYE